MSFLNRAAALRILPMLAAIGFVACGSPEQSRTATRTVTVYVSTDLVEVFGDLHAGDQVAVRGTDELPAGTRVQPKAAGTK